MHSKEPLFPFQWPSQKFIRTVSTVPSMPGVHPFHHPPFGEGREACGALRTPRDLEVPRWAMLGHPRVEGMIMILLVRKDREQTRKVGGQHVPRRRGDPPSSSAALVIATASNKPRVSTNRWRLRPFIFFPPSYPRSGAPTSMVLTDWLSMQAALGVGSCLASTRVRSRSAFTIFAQVPSSRHGEKES